MKKTSPALISEHKGSNLNNKIHGNEFDMISYICRECLIKERDAAELFLPFYHCSKSFGAMLASFPPDS